MSPLYALTIWPEWAWAICHLGKRVENRRWRPTTPAPIWLAIHAGSRFGGEPDATVYRPGHLRPVIDQARRAGWQTVLADGHQGGRRVGGHALIRGSLDGPVVPLPPLAPSPPTRAIVAVCRVVHYDLAPRDPWHVPGQWGWCLNSLVVLPGPVPCPGRQGLWRIEGELLARVREQWAAARGAA